MSTALAPLAAPAATNEPASVVRAFMPELDTIRGLAVAMVFWHHAVWTVFPVERQPDGFARMLQWTGYFGRTGVPLFFVISGLLITGILLRSRDEPRYFAKFYWRRALRILPPYLALLAVLGVAGLAPWSHIGMALVFLANLVIPPYVAYGPLWSLAVEEHFYAIWPLVVKKAPSTRAIAAVALGVAVVVPILRLVGYEAGDRDGLNRFTWYTADGLAIGALLGLAAQTSLGAPRTMARAGVVGLVLTAAVALALAPYGLHSRSSALGAALQNTTITVGFAALVAVILAVGSGGWAAAVRIAPLQAVGRVSYGLYLYHSVVFELYDRAGRAWWPELVPDVPTAGTLLVRAGVGAVLSFAIAWVSRWTFEEWFLARKDLVR